MKRWHNALGYSLFEMVTLLVVMGVVSAIALPAGRAAISSYQLKTAVKALSSDMNRVRLKALETNNEASLHFESSDTYVVDDKARRLPNDIRIADSSADSIAFNRLGIVTDGVQRGFVLVGPHGHLRELRVSASGAVEVLRL